MGGAGRGARRDRGGFGLHHQPHQEVLTAVLTEKAERGDLRRGGRYAARPAKSVWGRPSPRSSPHSGNTGTNTPSGTRLNRAPPDRRPASGSVGATTWGYPEGGRAGPPLRARSNRGAYEPSARSAPSLPAGLC